MNDAARFSKSVIASSYPSARTRSVDLGAGGLDDSSVLGNFTPDQRRELLGARRRGLGTLLGEERLHLRRAQDTRDLGVPLGDDLGRRARRRHEAPPGIDVES